MQLEINCKLYKPLFLPSSYNHILQAIIYASMANGEYSGYMHDKGFNYEKRTFKLFTFGKPKGSHTVSEGGMTFYGSIQFEVRSPDPFMIQMLKSGIEKNGIKFGNVPMSNIQLTCRDDTIESNMVLIEMNSPVTAHFTDPETRKRYYVSPEDEWFSEYIHDNFARKYYACYGVEPDEDLRIIPYEVTASDRQEFDYRETHIVAYGGKYVLAGSRKYLDFLYQTGIGSNNSQGFGMFDVLDAEELDS